MLTGVDLERALARTRDGDEYLGLGDLFCAAIGPRDCRRRPACATETDAIHPHRGCDWFQGARPTWPATAAGPLGTWEEELLEVARERANRTDGDLAAQLKLARRAFLQVAMGPPRQEMAAATAVLWSVATGHRVDQLRDWLRRWPHRVRYQAALAVPNPRVIGDPTEAKFATLSRGLYLTLKDHTRRGLLEMDIPPEDLPAAWFGKGHIGALSHATARTHDAMQEYGLLPELWDLVQDVGGHPSEVPAAWRAPGAVHQLRAGLCRYRRALIRRGLLAVPPRTEAYSQWVDSPSVPQWGRSALATPEEMRSASKEQRRRGYPGWERREDAARASLRKTRGKRAAAPSTWAVPRKGLAGRRHQWQKLVGQPYALQLRALRKKRGVGALVRLLFQAIRTAARSVYHGARAALPRAATAMARRATWLKTTFTRATMRRVPPRLVPALRRIPRFRSLGRSVSQRPLAVGWEAGGQMASSALARSAGTLTRKAMAWAVAKVATKFTVKTAFQAALFVGAAYLVEHLQEDEDVGGLTPESIENSIDEALQIVITSLEETYGKLTEAQEKLLVEQVRKEFLRLMDAALEDGHREEWIIHQAAQTVYDVYGDGATPCAETTAEEALRQGDSRCTKVREFLDAAWNRHEEMGPLPGVPEGDLLAMAPGGRNMTGPEAREVLTYYDLYEPDMLEGDNAADYMDRHPLGAPLDDHLEVFRQGGLAGLDAATGLGGSGGNGEPSSRRRRRRTARIRSRDAQLRVSALDPDRFIPGTGEGWSEMWYRILRQIAGPRRRWSGESDLEWTDRIRSYHPEAVDTASALGTLRKLAAVVHTKLASEPEDLLQVFRAAVGDELEILNLPPYRVRVKTIADYLVRLDTWGLPKYHQVAVEYPFLWLLRAGGSLGVKKAMERSLEGPGGEPQAPWRPRRALLTLERAATGKGVGPQRRDLDDEEILEALWEELPEATVEDINGRAAERPIPPIAGGGFATPTLQTGGGLMCPTSSKGATAGRGSWWVKTLLVLVATGLLLPPTRGQALPDATFWGAYCWPPRGSHLLREDPQRAYCTPPRTHGFQETGKLHLYQRANTIPVPVYSCESTVSRLTYHCDPEGRLTLLPQLLQMSEPEQIPELECRQMWAQRAFNRRGHSLDLFPGKASYHSYTELGEVTLGPAGGGAQSPGPTGLRTTPPDPQAPKQGTCRGGYYRYRSRAYKDVVIILHRRVLIRREEAEWNLRKRTLEGPFRDRALRCTATSCWSDTERSFWDIPPLEERCPYFHLVSADGMFTTGMGPHTVFVSTDGTMTRAVLQGPEVDICNQRVRATQYPGLYASRGPPEGALRRPLPDSAIPATTYSARRDEALHADLEEAARDEARAVLQDMCRRRLQEKALDLTDLIARQQSKTWPQYAHVRGNTFLVGVGEAYAQVHCRRYTTHPRAVDRCYDRLPVLLRGRDARIYQVARASLPTVPSDEEDGEGDLEANGPDEPEGAGEEGLADDEIPLFLEPGSRLLVEGADEIPCEPPLFPAYVADSGQWYSFRPEWVPVDVPIALGGWQGDSHDDRFFDSSDEDGEMEEGRRRRATRAKEEAILVERRHVQLFLNQTAVSLMETTLADVRDETQRLRAALAEEPAPRHYDSGLTPDGALLAKRSSGAAGGRALDEEPTGPAPQDVLRTTLVALLRAHGEAVTENDRAGLFSPALRVLLRLPPGETSTPLGDHIVRRIAEEIRAGLEKVVQQPPGAAAPPPDKEATLLETLRGLTKLLPDRQEFQLTPWSLYDPQENRRVSRSLVPHLPDLLWPLLKPAPGDGAGLPPPETTSAPAQRRRRGVPRPREGKLLGALTLYALRHPAAGAARTTTAPSNEDTTTLAPRRKREAPAGGYLGPPAGPRELQRPREGKVLGALAGALVAGVLAGTAAAAPPGTTTTPAPPEHPRRGAPGATPLPFVDHRTRGLAPAPTPPATPPTTAPGPRSGRMFSSIAGAFVSGLPGLTYLTRHLRATTAPRAPSTTRPERERSPRTRRSSEVGNHWRSSWDMPGGWNASRWEASFSPAPNVLLHGVPLWRGGRPIEHHTHSTIWAVDVRADSMSSWPVRTMLEGCVVLCHYQREVVKGCSQAQAVRRGETLEGCLRRGLGWVRDRREGCRAEIRQGRGAYNRTNRAPGCRRRVPFPAANLSLPQWEGAWDPRFPDQAVEAAILRRLTGWRVALLVDEENHPLGSYRPSLVLLGRESADDPVRFIGQPGVVVPPPGQKPATTAMVDWPLWTPPAGAGQAPPSLYDGQRRRRDLARTPGVHEPTSHPLSGPTPADPDAGRARHTRGSAWGSLSKGTGGGPEPSSDQQGPSLLRGTSTPPPLRGCGRPSAPLHANALPRLTDLPVWALAGLGALAAGILLGLCVGSLQVAYWGWALKQLCCGPPAARSEVAGEQRWWGRAGVAFGTRHWTRTRPPPPAGDLPDAMELEERRGLCGVEVRAPSTPPEPRARSKAAGGPLPDGLPALH